LQAEGHVGNLAVVSGDADKSRIGQEAETLQQILREAELKARPD
jgi:hypothetical protein